MIRYILSRFAKKLNFNSIRGSSIHKTSKIESGSQFVNSSLGRYSFCGYHSEIINTKVGSFCSIANDVKIGGAMHPLNWVSTSPVFYHGRDSVKKKFSSNKRDKDKIVVIGHDVWIGSNVLIKQGVTIGDGAVIGMGSVVTKNVEAYSIVGGNPAKEIRKRFSDEIIAQLLDIRWWDKSTVELENLGKFFNNVEKFIEEAKK